MRVTAVTTEEVQQYKAAVGRMNGFTSLMREHFELNYDMYKGYTKEEFEEVINETSDPEKNRFLRELRPRGDGREKLTQGEYKDWTSQRYERMLGCAVLRTDGRYDIVVVKASQIKEIDSEKLLRCGVGVAALGILAGVALGPLGFGLVAVKTAVMAGTTVAGAGGLGIAAKINSEKKDMSDVVCGYMVYELERRDVLAITNNQIVFPA